MIDFIVYSYIFLTAICIGSFLNVVIYRLPQKLSFVGGRSFCPSCKNNLKSYDLIPVFSFIFLQGKCRYCKEKLSLQYPLIELLTGLIALLLFNKFGFSYLTLVYFFISCILICVAVIDIKTMTIPDELVIALAVLSLFLPFINNSTPLLNRIIGFFALSVPMYILLYFIDGAFGGGDIKLIAVCGFILGYKFLLVGGFIAIFTAGIYASYLLISKKAKKGVHISFGQYICFGVFIAILYGRDILNFYLGFF